MKLLVQKLHEDAKLPTKSRETDEGYDIYALEAKRIFKNSTEKISTGIAAAAVEPVNLVFDDKCVPSYDYYRYWLQIEGRSGMASKGVFPIGGIVDCGYTGEIGVMLTNNGSSDYFVKKGDKIAQLVIRKHYNADIEEIESFEKTDRGSKGFGSSGN
jgi:dUTP pyrophosphatase